MSIIDDILLREGGWVDRPEDKGGATNLGVTLPTLSDWLGRPATVDELKNLTDADAHSLYQDLYIVRPGFQIIGSEKLLSLVVDMAVNHGVTKATKLLQKSLGVTDDGVMGPHTKDAIQHANYGAVYVRLCAERIRLYGRIISNDHSQAVFAAGWLNRVSEFVEKI